MWTYQYALKKLKMSCWEGPESQGVSVNECETTLSIFPVVMQNWVIGRKKVWSIVRWVTEPSFRQDQVVEIMAQDWVWYL